MTAQLIFSGVTLGLCAFFFVYFHIYIRRRTSQGSILAGYRDEVDRLIAEIDHATDRDTNLVEERIAALKKILDEADRRIALMSRDMEKRRSATELYTALGSRQPIPVPSPGPSAAPKEQSPEKPVPAGLAPPGPTPVEPVPAGSTPAGPAALDIPLTQRVLELSQQGFGAELIAARLDLNLAEVELALAVSRRAGP
jgi:hypothetical protein